MSDSISHKDIDEVSGRIIWKRTNAESWTSPTGHNDPDSKWDNEANAYDENTATYARQVFGIGNLTPKYLELTISTPILYNRVRLFTGYADNLLITNWSDPDIKVDVWTDEWENIHDGIVTKQSWVTLPFGDNKTITKARIIMNGSGTAFYSFAVHEFDFGVGEVVLSEYSGKTIGEQGGKTGEEITHKIVTRYGG